MQEAKMAAVKQRSDKGERSRIFLIDEQAVVRQGLTHLLDRESDLYVCGEADSVAAAIKAVPAARPDLVIMDIAIQGGGGVEPIRQIRQQLPKTPVMVLSSYDEGVYAERSLRAGAIGYATKREPAERVLAAIRRCLRGEIHVSERMANEILHRLTGDKAGSRMGDVSDLSDRELEVFQFLGRGLKVREIAQKLFLSTKTIESHREHIKQKLNMPSSAALLRYAIQALHEG
jgi:DNA-binding NarL/FixJ family response regulator